MAGTVKSAKIENRTARSRLKRGRQAHWRTLITGRAHIGYQRKDNATSGRWILRRYNGTNYAIECLGLADDSFEADGSVILNFDQAEAKARAILEAPRQASKRLTVRQAFARYVEFKHSQGQQTGDLIARGRVHILPHLGDKIVSELTPEMLRGWLSALASLPAMKRSPRGGKQAYKAAPSDEEDVRRRRSSANRILTMLKATLNHAFDDGLIARNDSWGRKLKPFRAVETARLRWLTVDEAKRLLNGCRQDFRKLVQGALATGCRYGELTRLKVEDFHADSGTIMIRRSKSGKARHVILNDEGVKLFSQLCMGKHGSELIFQNETRNHRAGQTDDLGEWRPSEQVRAMQDACTKSNLKPAVNFHALRHTWASLSVMNSVPLLVVAKNLGHTDTRMVEKHYGHLADNYVVNAIRDNAPNFGFDIGNNVVRLTQVPQTYCDNLQQSIRHDISIDS